MTNDYSNEVFYQFWALQYSTKELQEWLPFLNHQGYTAIYLTPIFLSSKHGYDTIDYQKVDPRFGTNEEFTEFVRSAHENNLKVVVDGVFNHVGRDFWAFRDVLEFGVNSQYKNWFKGLEFEDKSNGVGLDPEGSSRYFPEDGLNYQGWEGNFDLVLLNHDCSELEDYLMETVHFWQDVFKIDGIRLDVAYSLPDNFLYLLRENYDGFLLGEQIHGDYNRLIGAGLDSVTDYNAYKATWSSLLDLNFFELNWTLEKHQEEYFGKNLLTFLDNHDTDRIASRYTLPNGEFDQSMLRLAYALLFTIPGTPCVYYGAEIPALGVREDGAINADDQVRQKLTVPDSGSSLAQYIHYLINLKKNTPALNQPEFETLYLRNKQYVFARGRGSERKLFAINSDTEPAEIEVEGFSSSITLNPRSFTAL
ncbi:maltodextrin glucosidase [Actinomycetota bacterium]|nr:maltodextrin glucosidase [Actinomycetota bacterium]